MNPSVTPETFIVTTDWRGNFDETQPYLNRAPTAGSVFAEEMSVAPLGVNQGDEDIPILRINLENRESHPVVINEVYTTMLGTATEDEIDAVRLWVGPRESDWLYTDTFEQLTTGNSWYIDKVRLQLEKDLIIEPYTAVSTFITIDISETAKTLVWFDIWVLAGDGLITSSKVVKGDVHDSQKLVRIWNVTGGRFTNTVGINEVYPHPKQTGGNYQSKEWIELINPTSSAINLEDWTLQKLVGFVFTELYEFSSTYIIGGNYGYFVVNLTGNNLQNGTQIILFDNQSTPVMKSSVTVGSPDFAESYARYRMAGSDEPTGSATGGVWYDEDTPTPMAKNDPIPEFKDIIFPLIGTMLAYTIVRKRGNAKVKRRKGLPTST